MGVEIKQALPGQLSALTSVLGRAFVTEPMMRWPLGDHGDVEARFTRGFEYFLGDLIQMGMVWEAGAAIGAAAWIPSGCRGWSYRSPPSIRLSLPRAKVEARRG